MADKITVNSNNFKNEVLESDKTVLVDFWASWCGPCRMLSPLVDEIAKNMMISKSALWMWMLLPKSPAIIMSVPFRR